MHTAALSHKEILAWMAAASAVNFFGRVSISIAGPAIMSEYGLSAPQMGSVYSAFAASYAICMIPASALGDRFGPRRVLGIAGLVTSLCVLGTALAGSSYGSILPLLLSVRFIFGASAAPLYPACGRLTSNWFPPHRFGRIQGFVVGAGAFGSTLAPVVIGTLMARYGWQMAFYLGAIATATVFGGWLLRVRDYPPGSAGTEPQPKTKETHQSVPWAAVLRDRRILLLALSYFCVGYLYDLFDYWTYYYFREVRSFGEGSSAVFTTAAQATAMIMMPLGGWLSDMLASRWLPSFGRRTVPLVSLTLSATCLYAGVSATGAAAVALFCAAFGFAASVEGAYWATVIRIGASHAALAYGVVNAAGTLGGFVSPVVLPLVGTRFGWDVGLLLAGGVALTAAATWLFLGRERIPGQSAVEGAPAS